MPPEEKYKPVPGEQVYGLALGSSDSPMSMHLHTMRIDIAHRYLAAGGRVELFNAGEYFISAIEDIRAHDSDTGEDGIAAWLERELLKAPLS